MVTIQPLPPPPAAPPTRASLIQHGQRHNFSSRYRRASADCNQDPYVIEKNPRYPIGETKRPSFNRTLPVHTRFIPPLLHHLIRTSYFTPGTGEPREGTEMTDPLYARWIRSKWMFVYGLFDQDNRERCTSELEELVWKTGRRVGKGWWTGGFHRILIIFPNFFFLSLFFLSLLRLIGDSLCDIFIIIFLFFFSLLLPPLSWPTEPFPIIPKYCALFESDLWNINKRGGRRSGVEMTFASRHARLSFREAFLIRISSLENAGMERRCLFTGGPGVICLARVEHARARARQHAARAPSTRVPWKWNVKKSNNECYRYDAGDIDSFSFFRDGIDDERFVPPVFVLIPRTC